jgi:regulator of chromosome condensation
LRGDEQVTYYPQFVECLSGKKIVDGDAGTHHSLFRTADGEVIAIGRWTDGRCGVSGVAAATDGMLEEPKKVQALPGRAAKVVCGGVNGGAVLDDGDVYVWGSQYTAQLGLGKREEDAHEPVKMEYTKPMGGLCFSDLSFGGQHAAAVMVSKEDDDATGAAQPSVKRARQ